MSKYFDTVREPFPVTARGNTHTFYLRELGYLKFMEIQRTAGADLSNEMRGLAIMEAVAVACIEEENGSPSYTTEEWRNEIKEVVGPLAKAAMKAQGIDLDKVKDDAPAGDEEGNVEPSRISGMNSASTSAAPLESLSTG